MRFVFFISEFAKCARVPLRVRSKSYRGLPYRTLGLPSTRKTGAGDRTGAGLSLPAGLTTIVCDPVRASRGAHAGERGFALDVRTTGGVRSCTCKSFATRPHQRTHASTVPRGMTASSGLPPAGTSAVAGGGVLPDPAAPGGVPDAAGVGVARRTGK